MSEWKEYKLGEICDVRDGTHDSPKASLEGYPLVTSKNIKDGKIDLSNTYLISENDYKFVNQRSNVEQWDILYSMIGTIGECAIVKDVPQFAIKNVGLFKTNGNKILARWIYYYLQSSIALKELDGRIKGSTQQYISLTDLREFPIMIPPIEEQNQIVGVLSSLDDKIDLLNRENATLEALAETLFRHYFIENPDPTWKEGKLGEVCYYVTDKIDAAGLDRHSYISTENMLNEKKGVTDASSIPDNIRVTKYVVGDVLVSNIRPYFKKIWFADRNGGCSNDVLCIRAVNKEIENFVYYTLRQDDFFDYVMLGSKGCKMPRGDKQHIMNWQISVPDKGALTIFNEQVSTSIKKIKLNQQQIQILSTQRDTLLPRLMSGEVKVKGQ